MSLAEYEKLGVHLNPNYLHFEAHFIQYLPIIVLLTTIPLQLRYPPAAYHFTECNQSENEASPCLVLTSKYYHFNVKSTYFTVKIFSNKILIEDTLTEKIKCKENIAFKMVSLRTPSHKSSIIPGTCNLRNLLPSSCFPESYNLLSFKSKLNKLDLISFSLFLAFRFLLSSIVGAL